MSGSKQCTRSIQHLAVRGGKPEKVRTAPCLVAPLRPCAASGQTGGGCFGGAKETNNNPKKRGCPFETPSSVGDVGIEPTTPCL